MYTREGAPPRNAYLNTSFLYLTNSPRLFAIHLPTTQEHDTRGGRQHSLSTIATSTTMISLLEKEARDPVEVLRVKLKDSTDTSLLNSQLLQEIKHDYLAKQDSTKGQLDAFVQAHVDEIERASVLLEVGDSVTQIVRTLETLGQSCRKMNEELGDKKLLSGISIARRNLKELEHQIVFYEEMLTKVGAHTIALTMSTFADSHVHVRVGL